MSKFVEDLLARLREIERLIPGARIKERRALQKERSDLEEKIRRATS